MATGLDALGRLAAAELSEKLDADITVNFDALAKTDVAARAKAYRSLTEAGMDEAEAGRLAGMD